jgi:hypothetical protein
MNARFRELISDLDPKLQSLLAMPPVTVDTTPADSPVGGVYLFSKGGEYLYAGRTKKRIRDRLKAHVGTAKDCPFAWHLARLATNQRVASYRPLGSRRELLERPAFKKAYEDAKGRIRLMEVRYVAESDPFRQALLEIYVAVATNAKYNDFNTH